MNYLRRKLDTQKELVGMTFEPKTRNRFICKIQDKDGKELIPSWLITYVDRPKVTGVSSPSTRKWEPLSIEVYDPIVPSTAQVLYEYLFEPKSVDITIYVLGPVGDLVELWEIDNAVINTVDFGSLDWRVPHENNTISYINLEWKHRGGISATIKAEFTYQEAKLIF